MKKNNLIISLIGTLGMISTAIPALVSCSAKDITLTFDAGEHGQIVVPNTNNETCEYKTNSKTKFVDMLNKPQAIWGTDGAHEFQYWAVNGIKVEDDDVFSEDTTIEAVYSETHKWDGFAVENNHLYKTCSLCGEKELLTDEELNQHQGDFLYTLNNELVLVDDPLEEKSNTLSQILQSYPGQSVDVYLFGGTYEISANRGDENPLTVNLNGLLDNYNGRIAHLDCFNNNAPAIWTDKVYYCYGVNLNCKYLYMDGGDPKKADEHTFYCGIQANSLDCAYCYFTGVQSTYTIGPTFEYCTFDATENKVAEDDAEYSIYIRTTNWAKFENCNFKDIGKAVKIYTDGQVTESPEYIFKNCTFECIDNVDMKACVCIDSQFQTDDTKFLVHMVDCTNVKNSHEYSKKAQLIFKKYDIVMAEDSSTHSSVIWE